MKNILLFSALLFSIFTFSQTEPFNYDLEWASYFYCPEGNNITILASAIDKNENLYLVGGISQTCESLPQNDPLYNFHGSTDIYIAKFTPSGELLWFKYYGGSDYETAFSIKITNNNIFLGGTITSTDSSLNFTNDNAGSEDGFVSKLTLDGEVLWSTYIGGEGSDSVIVFDLNDEDEIYVLGNSSSLEGLGTPNTFQPENIVPDSHTSGFIAKIDNNGNKVWATYYGESESNYLHSIAVGETGVYVMGIDSSQEPGNYYGTPGSHKESKGTDLDNFIAKFSFEGERLWGTYFGGTEDEFGATSLSITTFDDKVYFCSLTASDNGISTPGAQQEEIGGSVSMFLTSLDAEGYVEWSTYAGIVDPTIGITFGNVEINNDVYGNLYISGVTGLSGLATPDAYKNTIYDTDAFVTKYNPQGEILWGTYFGGTLTDGGSQVLISDDSFIFTGYSHSEDIATPGAFRETLNPNGSIFNEIIVKFGPKQLSIPQQNKEQFVLWPNPTDHNIKLTSSKEIKEVNIYDIVGKLILSTSFKNETQTTIDLSGFMSGTYLLQVITGDSSQTQKVIKR